MVSKSELLALWQSLNQVNRHNIGTAPRQVQMVIMALVVLAVLVFAWGLLIMPSYQRLNAAQSQETTLIAQYQQTYQQAQAFEASRLAMMDEQAKRQAKLDALPKSAPMTQIVGMLNTKAQMHGVSIDSATVQAVSEQTHFDERTIQVVATGSYHQLGQWLTDVANSGYVLSLRDFDLRYESSDRLRISAMLIAYQAKKPESTAANSDTQGVVDGK